ncbi:hypothetical protein BH11PSE11_BH11PSE11_21140 [soil metagenome]
MLRLARHLWAGPNTILGSCVGLGVLLLGGHMRIVMGVMEFEGGVLKRAQQLLPASLRFGAITLGHVIIGIDWRTLNRVRLHEHVHVRQYERWGMFFLPAYLLSSLWQLCRGRRMYRDNVFEREAYEFERVCDEARLSRAAAMSRLEDGQSQ